MQEKQLFLFSIFFFALINTSYFWHGRIGPFSMFIFPVMLIIFILLFIYLTGLMIRMIKENTYDWKKIVFILWLTFVIVSTALKPKGILNYDRISGKDLLIAGKEGIENCTFTLKLKENHKFIERDICYGFREIKGKYMIKNDTIFFMTNKKGYYKFAVLQGEKFDSQGHKIEGSLILFKSKTDTEGYELYILKNDLIKGNIKI